MISKDLKKLEQMNKKLRERVADLENKKSEVNKKLVAANARIKYLEKQVPKANIKEVDKKMKGVEKEMSEMTTSESMVSEEILSTVKKVIGRLDNFKLLGYWLGWVCNCHISMAAESGSTSGFAKSGVDIHPQEKQSMTPLGAFLNQLEVVALEIYEKALKLARLTLESFVTKKVHNKWGIQDKDSTRLTQSQSDILKIMNTFYDALERSNIPYSIINQFFFQIFYYLNVGIFNSVAYNPSLVCFNLSIQIKVVVSELENWLNTNKKVLYTWNAYRPQLQPIIDLSNVLVLEKSSINSGMTDQAFHSLNVFQIKYFLDVYNQYNPTEQIPQTVIRDIARLGKMDEKERVSANKVVLDENKKFNVSDITYN